MISGVEDLAMMQPANIEGPGDIDPQVVSFLQQSGLLDGSSDTVFEPLTGGVASDIWKVSTPSRTFVVKKALPQLRVAQEWNAPVSRNASEVEWILEAAKVDPNVAPAILAHDSAAGAFAMIYLDPRENPVWKAELRDGRVDPAFAGSLGRALGAIHAATARSADIAARFANDAVFHSIRLSPYLEATASVHPDVGPSLMSLSRDVLSTKLALVHGDVSPKNILVGAGGPVILDAECAWYGDPAFDLAFCLNHLLLKCVWRRDHIAGYMESFDALSDAYLASVDWEPPGEIEARTARLLPALLLARIDGKSPVEYITADAEKELVRAFAKSHIKSPARFLTEIRKAWVKELHK